MKVIFEQLLLFLMEKLLPESDVVLLKNQQQDVVFLIEDMLFFNENRVIKNNLLKQLLSKISTIRRPDKEYRSFRNIFQLYEIVITSRSNVVISEQNNTNNSPDIVESFSKSIVLKGLADFIRDSVKPGLLSLLGSDLAERRTSSSLVEVVDENPIDSHHQQQQQYHHHEIESKNSLKERKNQRMDEIIVQNEDSQSPYIILSTSRRNNVEQKSEDDDDDDNDDQAIDNHVQFAFGCSLMMVLCWAATKMIDSRETTAKLHCSSFSLKEDVNCDTEEKCEHVDELSTRKSSINNKVKQQLQEFEFDLVICQVQKELAEDLFSLEKKQISNIELWKDLFEELLDVFPQEAIQFIYQKAKNISLASQLFIHSVKIRDEVLNQCRCEEETTALVFRLSEVLEDIQDELLIKTVFDVIIGHALANPTSREHLDCVIRAKRSLFGTTDESRGHLVNLYYWEQLLHVMQIVYYNRQLDLPQDPLLDESARQELANMTTMCVSNMLDHAAISHTNHPERQLEIQSIVDLIRHSGLYIASRMKQHDPEISWFFVHYIMERTCWYPAKQIRERANICVMVAKLDVPRLRWRGLNTAGTPKNKDCQPIILHKDLVRLVHQMLIGE